MPRLLDSISVSLFKCMLVAAGCLLASLARADVPVVTDGRPAAVIVTPERPTAVVRYAVQELNDHIERACGARLTVVAEPAQVPAEMARIYIGPCKAAAAAGVEFDAATPEVSRLKTIGNSLFIMGEDNGGDPLNQFTHAGTLWGVYVWLERTLAVRWLWPGELGLEVPARRTIVATEVDETFHPSLILRRLRTGMKPAKATPLSFTPEARKKYEHDEIVFLRRHRMGRSVNFSYGHAFEDWWERFGADHPDWFQLLASGKRGPSKPKARTSMCVSSPGLTAQIVEEWKQKREKSPGAFLAINGCENDVLGSCACENCRRWDGPPRPDTENIYPTTSRFHGTGFVTDRYAKFWLAIQSQARAIDPEAVVIGYAYLNYFAAPSPDVKLNRNIWIGFCPAAGWYPRSDQEQALIHEEWTRWRDSGATLFTRPNHFLDGYCMPHIFTRQFADDFQYARKCGIIATDFDSLTGQWSTQGPNLYLLARLHTRPEADPQALLGEYYSSFGPAAKAVRDYFEYWERFCLDARPSFETAFSGAKAARWQTYPKVAHEVFTPEAFVAAEKLLTAAEAAARPSSRAAARVEFLRKGFVHAQLCLAAGRRNSTATREDLSPAARKVYEKLIEFRRSTEAEGIANFDFLAWEETASWRPPQFSGAGGISK